jgi:hypothetical protein
VEELHEGAVDVAEAEEAEVVGVNASASLGLKAPVILREDFIAGLEALRHPNAFLSGLPGAEAPGYFRGTPLGRSVWKLFPVERTVRRG